MLACWLADPVGAISNTSKLRYSSQIPRHRLIRRRQSCLPITDFSREKSISDFKVYGD